MNANPYSRPTLVSAVGAAVCDRVGSAPATSAPVFEAPPPPPPASELWRAQTGSVALVHDYLLVMRGAERTFAAIADVYADAPIFTLLHSERGTGGRFRGRAVTASALQRLGVDQARFRKLLPLYPYAIESLRLPRADVVVSSSSAFAHGVRVPGEAVHVCYCYTPFRYAWDEKDYALGELPKVLRPLVRSQLRRIRRWDVRASGRVDAYIAISRFASERIRRHYGRDAPVVYPPVETERFAPGTPGEELLVVSEIVRHKRVHVALEAARRAHAPISVAGAGPDLAALKAAYPEASFLGRVGDAELARLYASARAVLVPSVEEFGITAVEAQAAGRPVIATGAGGATETVLDGRTGLLVDGDADSFARAIGELDRVGFESADAVESAARFSVGAFERNLGPCVAMLAERVREARARQTSPARRWGRADQLAPVADGARRG